MKVTMTMLMSLAEMPSTVRPRLEEPLAAQVDAVLLRHLEMLSERGGMDEGACDSSEPKSVERAEIG